ncbi:MAG TPA: biopolymer transporter ExbD [Polyangiaceae bacterium]|jgi:biopolymer transport protein ExbD
MAGGAGDSEEGAIYGINVTPLVDVMMVLLIIMMVTARILVSQGMPMELPKAAPPSPVAPKMLTVDITQDGQVFVDRQPVANNRALVGLARSAYSQDQDVRALIHADGKAFHGRVIRVLDILRQAGIKKIAFAATESTKK